MLNGAKREKGIQVMLYQSTLIHIDHRHSFLTELMNGLPMLGSPKHRGEGERLCGAFGNQRKIRRYL